ncbi:IS66 family transposase [Pseudovibrio sp. W64]|uniref:IS66 family transposase n=1 Tax=Pseudovibrio sp. W64 TaxID=1735583 RepID=UPI00187C6CF0|nr:transposase [Pseudovibrio sp. W64]
MLRRALQKETVVSSAKTRATLDRSRRRSAHGPHARALKARPYLDNNTTERAMRPVALGRKNYLFMGSEGGGKAAAIAYTFIETAKLNNVDPSCLAHVGSDLSR